jgi:hypothetical protein
MVTSTLERAAAVSKSAKSRPQGVQLMDGDFMSTIEKLERINAEVIIGHMARSKLAVEYVMSRVDSAKTRVCVVVCVHANAKRAFCPERSSLPVIIVMAKNSFLSYFGVDILRCYG